MKITTLCLRLFVFKILFLTSFKSANGQFTYVSPVPGSKMHNRETGIILKTGKPVDATSLQPHLFTVSGSISGLHPIKIKLASDDKTILVYPSIAFVNSEIVTVVIN